VSVPQGAQTLQTIPILGYASTFISKYQVTEKFLEILPHPLHRLAPHLLHA